MSHDIESLLEEMEKFGKPRLGKYNGWNCSVDMTVNAVGAEFKIDSGFGHKTPLGAVAECKHRMDEVLRGLNSGYKRVESSTDNS